MIALTGTHSTGKSTLLKALSERLPNLHISDGYSRPIKRIKAKARLSSLQIEYIIGELVLNEWLSNKDNPSLAMARTPLDTIAYAEGVLSKNELQTRLNRFFQGKAIIFYLPIEFPLVDDGERMIDEGYRKVIDVRIKKLLDDNEIVYITLTGSVEQRVETILKHI